MPREGSISVLIYVQHLLGIGHLVRARALAGGLHAAGMRVVLVSGGLPVPRRGPPAGRFEQLPPVRAADESFKVLLDAAGNVVDESWKARRRERLMAIFADARPDVLVTELYPFGRRRMNFELEPLLELARSSGQGHPGPLVVSSVRDIVVPPTDPGRMDEILDRLRRFYDLVLVHGDERLVPFRRSFERADDVADLIRSTGYLVGPMPKRQGPGAPGYGEVIVSAGGGAVGEPVLRAAVDARALCSLRDRTWRVLVGQNCSEDVLRSISASAPAGVRIERAREDFTQLLANCVLSISQGGYNTVAEILALGARAVCLPFAGGKESEQTLRCAVLAERGLVETVDADRLSPQRVAAAVERALARRSGQGNIVATNGAARSASLIAEALRARRAQ